MAGQTLYDLLTARRAELIASWSERLRGTVVSAALPRAELVDHIPAFVDEITRALYPEAVPLPPIQRGSGPISTSQASAISRLICD